MKRLIVLLMMLLGSIGARAEVAPCSFMDPWKAIRTVDSDPPYPVPKEREHKNLAIPFEVEILKGSGPVICSLNPGMGVSLVVRDGFNTKMEHDGWPAGKRSWVKVGSESYPILSEYELTVVAAPETKTYYLSQEQTQIIPQPPERYYFFGKEEQVVESSCGGWCGAAIATGLFVIYLLANKDNKSNPTAPNNPPAVTTGGAY